MSDRIEADEAPLRYTTHYDWCVYCAGLGCIGCDTRRARAWINPEQWHKAVAYYVYRPHEVAELRRVLFERNDLGSLFSEQNRYNILTYVDEVLRASATR